MIWRLRRRFILVSTLSVIGVLAVIFLLIGVFSHVSLDRTMDTLTDAVSSGRWKQPEPDRAEDTPPPGGGALFGKPAILGSESRFSTRYFTVLYTADGRIVTDTEHIHAVSPTEAVAYADEVRKQDSTRGWYGYYRYQVYAQGGGLAITFVDGSMNRAQVRDQMLNIAAILAGSGAVVLLMIVLFSRVAVKPAAESYEKQKQFITDANHELKTPLTLILTNVDIAEAELGKSEWLDDMREEGRRMAELIDRMVTLCRMDESRPMTDRARFSLTEVVADTVADFEPSAERAGKRLTAELDAAVFCVGDEGAIRRLTAILLDNAVKYCDTSGRIGVRLVGGRRPTLSVENDFAAVDETRLDRLFDRFYRSDRARTAGSGFGIGLSIARATAEAHRFDLTAYRAGQGRIGFRLTLCSVGKMRKKRAGTCNRDK